VQDAKAVKAEEYDESSVIEYVEEEYVDDMNDTHNDEDTNDGFEDEHGIINTDEDKRRSLESMEQAEGTHYTCDLCPKVYGN
jgi:hypothetical protein